MNGADSRTPWATGHFRWAPAGLREAVLRIELMAPSEVETASTAWKATLQKSVARWKLGHECSLEQWAALVAAVNGKYTCIGGTPRHGE